MSAAADTLRDRTAALQAAAGWLALDLDDVRLLLAQEEVRRIELRADLEPPAADGTPEIGRLARGTDRPWPVYCLDGALRLRPRAPAARRVCIFLGTGEETLGIVCDRAWPLAADADPRVWALPGCMKGAASPIAGFAQLRDGIVAVVTAASLHEFLVLQREAGHGVGE